MNQLKLLKHEKGRVYLLGTMHNASKSVVAVSEAVAQLQPHVVAIEMCLSRLERLANSSRTNRYRDVDLIPRRLKEKAMSEKVTLELIREALSQGKPGRRPKPASFSFYGDLKYASSNLFRLEPKIFRLGDVGSEIRILFHKDIWQLDFHSMKYLLNPRANYRIMLAGKPIQQTLDGIMEALSDDEITILKVYIKNFTKLFVANSSTVSIISHIIRKNEKLRRVLLESRYEYVANSLMEALHVPTAKGEPVRVLAVVKSNHVNGIRRYWEKLLTSEGAKNEKRIARV